VPAVAEGHVGPIETKDDLQRAPHEGVWGGKEVTGTHPSWSSFLRYCNVLKKKTRVLKYW
jgi:hypothetical protein